MIRLCRRRGGHFLIRLQCLISESNSRGRYLSLAFQVLCQYTNTHTLTHTHTHYNRSFGITLSFVTLHLWEDKSQLTSPRLTSPISGPPTRWFWEMTFIEHLEFLRTSQWSRKELRKCTSYRVGHAVAQWLRHWDTNRKVAGSIPDGVIGIFHWRIPSGRTMAVGLTKPLTEMSTGNISWW
jgi:hypothetical protein